MVELDDQMLRRLQLIELEILIEIDRICRKNNIHYSLTGGTLLGAVRNGGFIPWDDDADISMLRSEYRKFQEVCKTDLDQTRFYFQDIENTKGYRWGYGKVRRKNTIFLRENQEHMPYEQGVFVDIFPRDGIPDGFVQNKIHTFCCFIVRKIMWAPIGKVVAANQCIKLIYTILSMIPENDVKTMYGILVKKSNKNEHTKWVRALTFPLPNHQIGYRRCWYKKYAQIEFEQKKFMVESSYEKWLRAEFGDYMKLPPIEKRKVHPVTKLKLIDVEEQSEYEHSIADSGRKKCKNEYGDSKAVSAY